MANDDDALEMLVSDPETDPRATYVLEPDDVAHLVARVVTSPGAEQHTAHSPLTGAPLAAVPRSSAADVARASDGARAAQESWASVAPAQRARVLLALHDVVLAEQSDILDLIQLESGKARVSAFEEVADVAQVSRHYGLRGPGYLRERRVPGMLPVLTQARLHQRPIGVVGVIAPWNYPLTLALADVLPALLAGNGVVLKPDEQTALSALWAADALERAGLPAGLLQVVVGGAEVGSAVVDSVDHIVFTGSTATGRIIASQAGERLIGATLELGGKNPMYVAADADAQAAAAGAVRACFSNSGQLCMSIERLVLHESVAEAFLAEFLPRVRAMRLGAALDYSADMGSLVSAAQLARVTAHVDDAVARGARVLTGGVHRADIGELFYAPTVLADVPPEALCAWEETFGPVVSITVVPNDAAAIAAMNDTEYGLNASVWSGSASHGRALAAQVRAGTVNVNDGYAAAWGSVAAPLGGVKASGLGRRHGREGVVGLTEAQTIVVQRGGRHLSLDALFALPEGKGQALLTTGLRALRALRLP